MRKLTYMAGLAAFWVSVGCASAGPWFGGMAEKEVGGSGLYADTHAGFNPDTRSPELKMTYVAGDFQTVKAGSNFLQYTEESSGAWFNSGNVTRRRKLIVSAADGADLASAVADILQNLSSAATSGTVEK